MDNLRPLVSRCVAIENIKDPYSTRCEQRPDKNGYLCKKHFNMSCDHEIYAIVVKGTPRVLRMKDGFNIIGVIKDKKVLAKIKKRESKKAHEEVVKIVESDSKMKINANNPRIIESIGNSNSEEQINKMTPEAQGIIDTPVKEKSYIINDRKNSLLTLELDKLKVIARELRAKGLLTQKRFVSKEDLVDKIILAEKGVKNDKT